MIDPHVLPPLLLKFCRREPLTPAEDALLVQWREEVVADEQAFLNLLDVEWPEFPDYTSGQEMVKARIRLLQSFESKQ